MNALISGSAGLAATIDGRKVMLYKSGCLDAIPSSETEVKNIFKSYSDTIQLPKTNVKAVQKTLWIHKNRSHSLLMALTILDLDIDIPSKLELIKHLDDILREDSIYFYLLNILFTRPLAQNSIKSIPDEFKSLTETSKTINLITLVLNHQEKISSTSKRIKEIFYKNETPEDIDKKIEGHLTNDGFFYLISTDSMNESKFSSIKFSLINKLNFIHCPNSTSLIKDFTSSFKIHVHTGNTKETHKTNNKTELDKPSHYRKTTNSKRKPVDNNGEFIRVTRQIELIRSQLNENKIDKAKQVAKNLVEHQSKGGIFAYAAQSLCKIAGFARNLELHDLELEWALKASEIAPTDYRTYGHVADAYLSLDLMKEASDYFKKCTEDQGEGDNKIFGLTGLARIEKERHNLDLALEYINSVIELGHRDQVPFLVKAEILRDKRDFETSEKIYDYVCNEFPENSIPLNGKASLLVAQKRFDEAEDVYKHILGNYSNTEDIKVTACAYGFLLARLGRFKEAHKFIDQSIFLSPFDNIIATLSKAKTYKMEGLYKNAEKILVETIQFKPQLPQPIYELLDLYAELNRNTDGLKVYKNTPNSLKSVPSIQIAYSRLLKNSNNFQDALQIIDSTLVMEPQNLTAMLERASIFKMIGNFQAAQEQYLAAMKVNNNDLRVRFGLRILSQIQKNIKYNEIELNTSKPKTVEDYHNIGLKGLVELANGNYKEAKKLLQLVNKCPFMSLKNTFCISLSMANLKLNQKAPSLKALKQRSGILVDIQKLIILANNKNLGLLKELTPKNDSHIPAHTNKVIQMIDQKYISKTDLSISEEAIYSEQITSILIAA